MLRSDAAISLGIYQLPGTNALEVEQNTIIGGPVEGKIALLFDDMISTAGSICGAARLVHQAGASEIHIACTHGVLCGPATQRIRDAPFNSIIVTDTIPVLAEKQLPILVTPEGKVVTGAIKINRELKGTC